ncbi:MAG: methyltransferase domain-containing protein [Deltaproteobacteria bacterium]|jgi:ubiquinone/menaquinone biosynthesis C-methylase UbiE|nr:methyltransferase domain-containing protein [Deltaproteobacteria bacterium]
MLEPIDTEKKLKKIRKAYDSPPWWYDIRGFFILKLSYNDSLIQQIRFFGQNTGGSHLEAAIGTGTLAKMIYLYNVYIQRKPKWHGYGFDYSDEMLEGSRQKFKDTGFEMVLADVGKLPFENGQFSTINVANALHCFPELDQAIKELYRVLSRDGSLYVNVILYPNEKTFFGHIAKRISDWGMKKGILYRPYYQDEIIDAFKNQNFTIVSAQRSGNSLNLILDKQRNSLH